MGRPWSNCPHLYFEDFLLPGFLKPTPCVPLLLELIQKRRWSFCLVPEIPKEDCPSIFRISKSEWTLETIQFSQIVFLMNFFFLFTDLQWQRKVLCHHQELIIQIIHHRLSARWSAKMFIAYSLCWPALLWFELGSFWN